MKQIIFILKVTVICCLIASCSSGKAITGEISHVSGDTACLPGKCFLLLKNAPKAYKGQKATFTPVRSRKDKRINAIHIK